MNLYVFETEGKLRAYWRGKHKTLAEAWEAIQAELSGHATVVYVERIK
jgi:hypothetical protein